jgi:hypothetical protein
MAINLSALSLATTKATALSNLLLVTPQKNVGYQPQNSPSWKRNTSPQPKSIVFNYEGEQTATLESDITDHFIEDNTPVQDQIALKPEVITTHGFVGELNDISPAALLPLKFAAEKLTTINAYTPALSATALLAYNNAFQLYQVGVNALNSAVAAWSSINGGSAQSVINGAGITAGQNQSKQQLFFQQFYGYWKTRTLFTVQTPWAVFQDMAIHRLRAIQNEDTLVITDFEVTFKLMRFASTISISGDLYNTDSFLGRSQNQGAKEIDLGTSALERSSVSFASVVA